MIKTTSLVLPGHANLCSACQEEKEIIRVEMGRTNTGGSIEIGLCAECAYDLTLDIQHKIQQNNKIIKVGDVIWFGKYDWRVLDVQDDKALIISENIIGDKAYHNTNKSITWEHSTIRKWLNNKFLNNTFAPEEKKRIVKTKIKNNNNPHYDTPGGNNTTDKIFLLSIDEYKAYENIISNATNWWWLRSPGYISDNAAFAIRDGGVSVYGIRVNYDITGVRPALWVKL